MTEHNHRRGTRETLSQEAMKKPGGPISRFGGYEQRRADKPWQGIDKSLHGTAQEGAISGKRIGSKGIGNDFTNGHRGMAKAVRGAKKFVRTRIRFHENAATRKLANESAD